MKRFIAIIVVMSLLMFSIGYIQRTFADSDGLKSIQNSGFYIVSKTSIFFNSIGKKIASPFHNFTASFNVLRDYRMVSEELERSRVSQLQYKMLILENNQLREELRYRNQKLQQFNPIAAEVVNRGLDSWFDSVVIDKGWKDGIEEDMPVVNTRGLVGRVVKTTEHLSNVMLLINENSDVSAMAFDTQDKGIIQGRGLKSLFFKYVPHSSKVANDMKVYTSGISLVFPRGILVGYVSKVVKKKYDHLLYVEVIPAVNFAKLDRVWVITGKTGYAGFDSKNIQSK